MDTKSLKKSDATFGTKLTSDDKSAITAPRTQATGVVGKYGSETGKSADPARKSADSVGKSADTVGKKPASVGKSADSSGKSADSAVAVGERSNLNAGDLKKEKSETKPEKSR